MGEEAENRLCFSLGPRKLRLPKWECEGEAVSRIRKGMSGALLSFFFVGAIVKVVRLMKAAPLQPRLCSAGSSLCKLAGALDLSYLVVWLLTSSGVRCHMEFSRNLDFVPEWEKRWSCLQC